MDIKDIVSVEEAAQMLGYEKSSVALLCRQGKLDGAFRLGHRWLIPRKTVETYEKGPQGFAAIWQRRREAEKAEAESYVLSEDEHSENAGDLVGKKNIELEILRNLKFLVKEVRALRRVIAQGK